MDTDLQRLVFIALQGVVTILCAVLWFLFREARAKAEATAKELADYRGVAAKDSADFKTYCAQTYATHSDLAKAIDAFNRSIDAVFAKLDRIEDKLDKKADK